MDKGESKVSTENPGNESGSKSDTGLPPGLEPVKRGRGRPPKDPNSPLNTAPKPKAKSIGNENGSSLESAKFVAKGFVGLVELVESMVHANCAAKIEKKYPQKLVEFKEMAKSVALNPKDAELMEASAEKIALKYDVLSKWGPEVILSVTMLQYSMRQLHLIKFVDNMTKEPDQPKTAEPGAVVG